MVRPNPVIFFAKEITKNKCFCKTVFTCQLSCYMKTLKALVLLLIELLKTFQALSKIISVLKIKELIVGQSTSLQEGLECLP